MKPMIELISPTTKPHSRILIFLPPILPRTSSQMKTFFALFLSSLLLFSCGTDEPQLAQDPLRVAAEAYPLITETPSADFSSIAWRVPLIPRQLLTATQDSSRWLILPPTAKDMVSFDIWIEGEVRPLIISRKSRSSRNFKHRPTPNSSQRLYSSVSKC